MAKKEYAGLEVQLYTLLHILSVTDVNGRLASRFGHLFVDKKRTCAAERYRRGSEGNRCALSGTQTLRVQSVTGHCTVYNVRSPVVAYSNCGKPHMYFQDIYSARSVQCVPVMSSVCFAF